MLAGYFSVRLEMPLQGPVLFWVLCVCVCVFVCVCIRMCDVCVKRKTLQGQWRSVSHLFSVIRGLRVSDIFGGSGGRVWRCIISLFENEKSTHCAKTDSELGIYALVTGTKCANGKMCHPATRQSAIWTEKQPECTSGGLCVLYSWSLLPETTHMVALFQSGRWENCGIMVFIHVKKQIWNNVPKIFMSLECFFLTFLCQYHSVARNMEREHCGQA